ncbi:bridge-like lipid transfer protein family member hobbit [Brevipalpus obovatus]|uniref:bridge-like lipid transfer protein family member hobbit n=1 Tax=Brevipalpus obovatus TaxID=246614 RepID=UPI003D9E3E5F
MILELVRHFISPYFIIFLLLTPFIFWIILRLFLSLVKWYLDTKYKIKFKFVGIRFLGVDEISFLLPNGYKIEADCLWFSAHFRSSNQFLCLNISEFRLKGHLSEFDRHSTEVDHKNCQPMIENSFDDSRYSGKKLRRLLIVLVRVLKCFSLRVTNLSFNLLAISDSNQAECLLNSTIQELGITLGGKGSTPLVRVESKGGCTKLLRHSTDDTCLANISFDIILSLSMQNTSLDIDVSLEQLDTSINEGIFALFSQRGRYRNGDSDQSKLISKKALDLYLFFCHLNLCNVNFKNNILKIQVCRDRGQRILTFENEQNWLKISKKSSNSFLLETELSNLKISSNHCQLASFEKFSLEMNATEEKSMNHCLKLVHRSELISLHLCYNSSEIDYWHCLIRKSSGRKNSSSLHSNSRSPDSTLSMNRLLGLQDPLLKFSSEVEFKDIQITFLPNSYQGFIVSSLQTGKLTAFVDPDPIKQEASFEFLLDSFTSRQKDSRVWYNNPTLDQPCRQILSWKSCHFRLFHTTFSKSTIHCSIDSPTFDIDCIESILQHTFHKEDKNVSSTQDRQSSQNSPTVYILELQLYSMTALSKDLRLSIESLILKRENSKTSVHFTNSYIHPLYSLPAEHDKHLFSTKFEMIFNMQTHERSFVFTDDNYLLWSVLFHLSVIQAIKKIKFIWRSMKRSQNNPENEQRSLPWTTLIKLGNNVKLGALVSNEGHTIFFNFKQFIFEKSAIGKTAFKADCLVSIVMDGNTIGRFETIRVKKYLEADSSTTSTQQIINRKEMMTCGLGLSNLRNQVYLVFIENIKLVFPYRYNFANTFNEKFFTILKWLKKHHNSSSEQIETLKCDLVLKIQTFSMEIGDDPFEVKLRDNYELMEDEYHESKKRIQMWREKIDESKKKMISLGETKLNELYAALSKKQENVYIERHRKLYATSPPRTHLFLLTMENFDMKIAADGNLTGYEKLIDLMKNRLDKQSPFPPDLRFVTLWGRFIQGSVGSFSSRLRDFPKPLLEFKNLSVNGLLIGAEREAASRSRRECFVDVGIGREPFKVERSMNPLKLYHDLHFNVDSIAYTHGSSWEPVLQQLSLCFEYIIKPSADPSPTLPWWDRVRLLLHGNFCVTSSNLSLFFHASLNPYNSTELIEFAFSDSIVEWITGKIGILGNVSLLVHTASKYDDRRIVYLPNAKISFDLLWECLGNPFDHHSVAPHAADKVPEYSIHQNWDSYRAFRSQNLKVRIYIENTKADIEQMPTILLFSSTFKWLENQKTIFRGIARLTRRGKLFGNTKPRKKPFTRIFKEIRVTMYLKKFKVYYWSSLSKQLGLECYGDSLTHSAHHNIFYVPHGDGLCRRARPVTYIACMNSEVSNVEVWLTKNENDKVTPNLEESEESEPEGAVKNYFFSFETMSYNRASSETTSPTEIRESPSDPTHRLVVRNLKGAWTKQNRDIAISLFDLYMNAEQLKRNLSTDALKAFKIDGQVCYMGGSPVKSKFMGQTQANASTTSTTSPASTLNKNYAASMLQKLIAESEGHPDGICTEDSQSVIVSEEPKLRGITACSDENLIRKTWLIELVNSQVMLRGCETLGYVIVSAAKTQIVQKLYTPVWKDRTLLSKTALVGSIECMQYYATVEAQNTDEGDINWLSMENIEERTNLDFNEPLDIVGSGQSAGGFVSPVVGRSDILSDDDGQLPIQLQRIISRCSCQFYYVNYSKDIPPEVMDKAPPLVDESDLHLEPWAEDIAVDSFTMNHHDLEIYTNSQQFAMIMDMVNNLLLYVEPHKREAFENLQRMKFKSVLDPTESLRGPILAYQDNIRAMVMRLKQSEKESYFLQRAFLDEKQVIGIENETMKEELATLERQIRLLKEKINRSNEELTLMINLFKESQLTADRSKERQTATQEGDTPTQEVVDVARRIEICFKQACWKLTDSDGQMGLAKVELNNFIYTKVVKSDDSFEHSLELGHIKVSNLLPNQKYPIVLEPTPSKPNIPVDSRRALRIYCQESPPQNGIPIKEHFEVNVIPLNVMITLKFYLTMKSFFFDRDERNPVIKEQPNISGATPTTTISTNRRKARQKKGNSTITNSLPSTVSSASKIIVVGNNDDIEKMRQRAQRSKIFVYIKITEALLKVTYRGNNDKNVVSIQDLKFTLPTIEYHNRTWEWLDLINAIKSEIKRRLLSQAFKQKLGFSANKQEKNELETFKDIEISSEKEERNAKVCFGDLVTAKEAKTKSLEKTFKGLSSLIHRHKQA